MYSTTVLVLLIHNPLVNLIYQQVSIACISPYYPQHQPMYQLVFIFSPLVLTYSHPILMS